MYLLKIVINPLIISPITPQIFAIFTSRSFPPSSSCSDPSDSQIRVRINTHFILPSPLNNTSFKSDHSIRKARHLVRHVVYTYTSRRSTDLYKVCVTIVKTYVNWLQKWHTNEIEFTARSCTCIVQYMIIIDTDFFFFFKSEKKKGSDTRSFRIRMIMGLWV